MDAETYVDWEGFTVVLNFLIDLDKSFILHSLTDCGESAFHQSANAIAPVPHIRLLRKAVNFELRNVHAASSNKADPSLKDC